MPRSEKSPSLVKFRLAERTRMISTKSLWNLLWGMGCVLFVVWGGLTASAGAVETVFPGDDWQEATPKSQGVHPAKLEAAVACMESHFGPDGAKELAIVRNGYLIWKGPDIDANHPVWSCTKTFTSTVLGLLIADGKCTLDTLAIAVLPDLDDAHPLYAKIELRHLASMTSGYHGQVVNVTPQQEWGDPMSYLQPAAPFFEAGTKVQYHDHGVHLLGSILTRIADEPVRELFKRRIADPIGMKVWDWGVCGSVNGIALNNVSGVHGTGLRTTARQMARYGHLWLNRGNWNGEQLLPASFVDEATRNQVTAAGASTFLHKRYGFYWWTNDVKPDGKRPWPSAPPKTYTAHGHSANFCFVIPEWNMVAVRMGTIAIAPLARQDALWDTFFAKLADAVTQ